MFQFGDSLNFHRRVPDIIIHHKNFCNIICFRILKFWLLYDKGERPSQVIYNLIDQVKTDNHNLSSGRYHTKKHPVEGASNETG